MFQDPTAELVGHADRETPRRSRRSHDISDLEESLALKAHASGCVDSSRSFGSPNKTISPSLSNATRVPSRKCLGDIVGDKNHGFTKLLLQRFKLLLELTPGDRVQGTERFVQQNHRRIGRQSARYEDR